jgi:hypothetical protein
MTLPTPDQLRFDIDVAIRYHQRRRAWWMTLDRLVKGISVLAGSTALVGLITLVRSREGSGELILLLSSFLIALLNAWDLVVGFAQQAQTHHDLAKGYVQLDADLVAIAPSDEAKLEELYSQYILFGKDEPPVYWAIYTQCYNQALIARSLDEKLRALPLWKLYLGYLFRMHEQTFVKA